MWDDPKIEQRVMQHAAKGKPLSELRLPFRTVIRALCRCGLGVVGRDGTYAVTFDRLLAAAWSVKPNEAVRFERDQGYRAWLMRDNVTSVISGDIGRIWSGLEEARVREQQQDHWAD